MAPVATSMAPASRMKTATAFRYNSVRTVMLPFGQTAEVLLNELATGKLFETLTAAGRIEVAPDGTISVK